MKPLNDFLIKADIELESQIMVAGKVLYFDPDFNPYKNAVQFGTVAELPLGYEGEVKKGDTCFFHHFVVAKDNHWMVNGEKMYICTQQNLWAVKRRDEIIPIGDLVFCEQVYEPEENCKTKGGIWLKATPDKVKQTSIVKWLSTQAKERGLQVNDKIYTHTGTAYDMKIQGVDYQKVQLRYVLGRFKEKSFEPLAL